VEGSAPAGFIKEMDELVEGDWAWSAKGFSSMPESGISMDQ